MFSISLFSMKKILAYAGSNSSTSINQTLVDYTSSLLDDAEVKHIKLTDYDLPMYGEDIEKEEGFPNSLKALRADFKWADAILLSVNEHNGTVSAFYKNVMDWLSRLEYKFLENKPVFLMSTSSGKRGARSAREYTEMVLPRFDAGEITTFELPSYSDNFKNGKIINEEFDSELKSKLKEWMLQMA